MSSLYKTLHTSIAVNAKVFNIIWLTRHLVSKLQKVTYALIICFKEELEMNENRGLQSNGTDKLDLVIFLFTKGGPLHSIKSCQCSWKRAIGIDKLIYAPWKFNEPFLTMLWYHIFHRAFMLSEFCIFSMLTLSFLFGSFSVSSRAFLIPSCTILELPFWK